MLAEEATIFNVLHSLSQPEIQAGLAREGYAVDYKLIFDMLIKDVVIRETRE